MASYAYGMRVSRGLNASGCEKAHGGGEGAAGEVGEGVSVGCQEDEADGCGEQEGVGEVFHGTGE